MTTPEVADVPLHLRYLSTLEISQHAGTVKVVLLPTGSVEQHGSHLPIDTDLRIAEYLAEKSLQSARAESGKLIGFIAPPLPFGGPTLGMQDWPGTLTLPSKVYIDVVSELAKSLAKAAFRYVVILNGCMGNSPALQLAVQKAKHDALDSEFILLEGFWAAVDVIESVRESDTGGTGHAGEIETSIMLALDPASVRRHLMQRGYLHHPSPLAVFDLTRTGPFYWPVPFRQMMDTGVCGDPQLANTDKGRKIIDANVKRIQSILLHLDQLSER